MSIANSLPGVNNFILERKILAEREHYDLEDLTETKLGEADGNLFQFPAKFVVIDTNGSELMHLGGKVLSLQNQFTFYDETGVELGTVKKKIVKLIGNHNQFRISFWKAS